MLANFKQDLPMSSEKNSLSLIVRSSEITDQDEVHLYMVEFEIHYLFQVRFFYFYIFIFKDVIYLFREGHQGEGQGEREKLKQDSVLSTECHLGFNRMTLISWPEQK